MRSRDLCSVLCVVCLCPLMVAGQSLPNTKPLTLDQPLDVVMVDGIDRFCLKELAGSTEQRARHWKRDLSSPEAYVASIQPNRERFRTIIGAVDPRVGPKGIELIATTTHDSVLAKCEAFTVHAVRWHVLEGVTAEGLLLQPSSKPIARMIALPDADWTPEQFTGLAEGVEKVTQIPARLAAAGCQVLVPTLISRDDEYSGNPEVRMTNQPHREWVYRMGFEMGRHVIGYEVQKVLAALDEFDNLDKAEGTKLPMGVVGVGEGGLLALYSAALDDRIKATMVCGYFGPRENLWQEPIYRNVWALLREFGDAEIATMIAPRGLVVEASKAPEWAGPSAPKQGRSGGAAPGKIVTPTDDVVLPEVRRAVALYGGFPFITPAMSGQTLQPAGGALLILTNKYLGLNKELSDPPALTKTASTVDVADRQKRQVQELVDFTQTLLRKSWKVRDKLWSKADRSSVDAWAKTADEYRDMVYEELIGRLPAPTIDPNVRTRQVLDEPEYTGYEVVIDVYPDVIAGGILLLPKDLQPNEKRPVVVCQHGLEGVPMDTISKTAAGYPYYKGFTAELAKRGFITYAPQNPYRGTDRFRTLQRKSNPMKRSLFTYIIPQHQRTIDFLKTLPNVDPARIGFYGLSYGGKTAVRVPPMLKDYALSICSADFNEWVFKNTTTDLPMSYVFTGEYEIFEWNMGHVANYAELSMLMTPRPFMVERGHTDGVSLDEYVAFEYAKVFRHYNFVGLNGKTEIEVFNGPHTINGVGTYEFLHKHLQWPKKDTAASGGR